MEPSTFTGNMMSIVRSTSLRATGPPTKPELAFTGLSSVDWAYLRRYIPHLCRCGPLVHEVRDKPWVAYIPNLGVCLRRLESPGWHSCGTAIMHNGMETNISHASAETNQHTAQRFYRCEVGCGKLGADGRSPYAVNRGVERNILFSNERQKSKRAM